jgi:hypothetical protein
VARHRRPNRAVREADEEMGEQLVERIRQQVLREIAEWKTAGPCV